MKEFQKLFTEEVCSRIVDYSYDINIVFKKNCTSCEFGKDVPLSYDNCRKKLYDLLNIVRLFEKD